MNQSLHSLETSGLEKTELEKSEYLFDLHCHSTCSDGQLTVEALVARAAENGVTHLALTDHDTTIGWGRALKAAEPHSLKMISGIEISTLWNGRNIHLVGLNFDPEHPSIMTAVAHQTEARLSRAKLIAEKLQKRFDYDLWPELLELCGEGVPGRPHFAQLLVKHGFMESIDKAFKKVLGSGKIGDVKTEWPSIEQAIRWVKEAGGSVIIAHPDKYKLTRTKARLLFDDFQEAGGDGIEVSTGNMDLNFKPFVEAQLKERNLFASCGSDFHGPTPWSELGKFAPISPELAPIWHAWEKIW